MKKTVATVAVAVGLAFGAADGQAVNCHSFGCLNRAVNKLQKVVKADHAALSVLSRCINEVPVTDYGVPPSSGYIFDPGAGQLPFATTALDVTSQGDPVDAWVMYDKCNTTPTASSAFSKVRAERGSGVFTPIARPFFSPFREAK